MASKYDVFYTIALKGELSVKDIAGLLNRNYNAVFNHVLELENQGYIQKGKTIKIIHNKNSARLFNLVSFCANNSMNYNILFRKDMLDFIQKAAGKGFFTTEDIKVHPQTFKEYIGILSRYGLLLIISRKPLKCKLLKNRFIFDLMEFFRKKTEFYNAEMRNLTPEISKELVRYKRNIKIGYSIVRNLEEKQEANFIYASLNLEGNPLTLPETQKLVLENIVPEKQKLEHIQEVNNYRKAMDLMIANARRKTKLDKGLILQYHGLAMRHISGAGIFRKQNVVIKGNPLFKTADWREINEKIKNLFIKYNSFESEKRKAGEIIEFAAFFHNEFQRIHPFIDGNSRISRLLMLHILRSHELPVLELPIGYFDEYLSLTKKSKARDDKALNYLLQEIILAELKRLNGMF